jgi:hypothetical protein
MVTITVKNIPDEIYERLKLTAKANRRSINSQIITIIEEAVRSKKIDHEILLLQARQLREATAGYAITDEEFNQMKDAGRP